MTASTLPLLLLGLLMYSAEQPASQLQETLQITAIAVDRDSDGSDVSAEATTPLLSPIPGQIFGNPDWDVMVPLQSSSGSTWTIDLAELALIADEHATTQTESSARAGLRVEPGDARILRFGTFGRDETTDKLVGAGIIELPSKKDMILIWVDRPCTITGGLRYASDVYNHDIHLDTAGFHWVRAIDDFTLVTGDDMASKFFMLFH